MMATKKRPRVGNQCWEVEWRAPDPPGRAEDDEPVYRRRNFGSREEALAWAKANFCLADEGGVPLMTITPYEFVPYDNADAVRYPHIGFWEATADPECYEGE